MDFSVFVFGANEFDLSFDGIAGVFVLAGAVAGDEERRFAGLWRAREWMLRNGFLCAREQDFGHAVVGADRTAVMDRLVVAAEDAFIASEAEFARNHFVSEVAFADKKRDAED